MRTFLVLTSVLIGAFLAVDEIAFDGHYRQAPWQEAKHRGQQFNRQIGDWFKRSGLK